MALTKVPGNMADESLMPAGMLAPFAGASAPSGWLLCYGQAVSRTTYATLFAAISTAYGVGDGSTTFNLPDLRGRVPAGKDDMGGAAASRLTTASGLSANNTLGATGGSQTHTLTTGEIPAHSHAITSVLKTNGVSGISENRVPSGGGSQWGDNFSWNTDNSGSGGAHTNVQPVQVVNYIIKT